MDQNTFKNSVFVFKDKLYRFAKSILISSDEAFDVVQEVMLRFWEQRNTLARYRNLEAYCMQAVRNECLNRIKHHNVVEDHQKSFESKLYSSTPTNNIREIIVEMISNLPEKQRMVMHLKDIEDYSIDEISETLEMETNAVRVNLMRARQKIKSKLEMIFEYENKRSRF